MGYRDKGLRYNKKGNRLLNRGSRQTRLWQERGNEDWEEKVKMEIEKTK
jgi:hypothetical protein